MVSTTEANTCEQAQLQALATLNQAGTVRERAGEILAAGERGALAHFNVHPQRLADVATQVASLCRVRFADLDIPLHSRWRHFCLGDSDYWQQLQSSFVGTESRARAAFDLAITSVLLDAGAGMVWKYQDPVSGKCLSRSEGLALASFNFFRSGGLSSDPEQPLQADAEKLMALTPADVETAFQVRADNPLVGVEGRTTLLNNLGRIICRQAEIFPLPNPRPGHLYDYLKSHSSTAVPRLPATAILATVLRAFSEIWPGRLTLAGVNLGDVWYHPAIVRNDPSTAMVPFHKLSQWLSYSLVEPLQDAGLEVTGLDELTGLAEYRNGGLFIDYGVLELCDDAAVTKAHAPDSELIVEWRALTIALLDRLAPLVRQQLGVTSEVMPLVRILEGGTWLAGRNIAQALRTDGGPPLRIISDGTVF